jgi:hypothetical protein
MRAHPENIALAMGLLGLALILGALGFQYLDGLPPCEMCMWQRYPHIAAAVIGLGGGLVVRSGVIDSRLGRPLAVLTTLLVALSGAIAVYHAGVEWHWWKGPGTCTGNGFQRPARSQRQSGDVRRGGVAALRAVAGGLQRADLAGRRGNRRDPARASEDKRVSKRKSRPAQPGIATGDDVEAMIRVDHAGEYGAVRIYEGQLAVLGRRASKTAAAIRRMAEQEQRHLKAFDTLINERRVRPDRARAAVARRGICAGSHDRACWAKRRRWPAPRRWKK